MLYKHFHDKQNIITFLISIQVHCKSFNDFTSHEKQFWFALKYIVNNVFTFHEKLFITISIWFYLCWYSMQLKMYQSLTYEFSSYTFHRHNLKTWLVKCTKSPTSIQFKVTDAQVFIMDQQRLLMPLYILFMNVKSTMVWHFLISHLKTTISWFTGNVPMFVMFKHTVTVNNTGSSGTTHALQLHPSLSFGPADAFLCCYDLPLPFSWWVIGSLG